METPDATPNGFAKYRPWLLVGLVILLVGFVRVRLRDIPLERDEGEYAYMGQLMLEGIPPYKIAYNMKLPGTYAGYAAIMTVFGQTSGGIHLGLLLVNAASIVLIFLLGQRLFDDTTGVMAAATYGVMTLSPQFMGLSAHATHFVTLPALGAMLCLLRAVSTGRRMAYFSSGLLFGVAFLMKQQGVFFPLFGGAWILWDELRQGPRNWERLGQRVYFYSLGCALPFAATCLALWYAGVFETFWFWTFEYARAYVSQMTWSDGASLFNYYVSRMATTNWPLGALAAIGFVMLWWQRPARGRDLFASAFLLFSFLTVCPGLYFRNHYFITVLPAVALLAGVAVSFGQQRLKALKIPGIGRQAMIGVAALVLAFPLWTQRETFFVLPPLQAAKQIHPFGPFIESQEIAKYIREHSTKDARVGIIGSEPQICFYAHRHSATGFLYTYALVENQPFAMTMQQQMIREIEVAEPEFLVLVDVGNSWLTHPNAPKLIFEWMGNYFAAHYQLVGVASMVSLTETEYVWDDAVKNRTKRPGNNLLLLKRTPPKAN